MNWRRPTYRLTVHGVLVMGALLFSVPFVWMVGTSMKVDKEVFTNQLQLLPARPIPRARSPYVATDQYPAMEAPDGMPQDEWRDRLQPLIVGGIRDALARANPPCPPGLDERVLERELIKGLWDRLRSVLPPDAFRRPASAIKAEILKKVTPAMVSEIFDACYRRFSIRSIRVNTPAKTDQMLLRQRPTSHVWMVVGTQGAASLTDRTDQKSPYADVRYNLEKADRVVFEGIFQLGEPVAGLRKIRFNFRSDESWNQLSFEVEKQGRLYRSDEVTYLHNDQWQEVTLQEPGPEDESFRIKRWILIQPVDDGLAHLNEPAAFRMRVILNRSSDLAACWGKALLNYKRAVRYVPFWRYASTSFALVALNIIGAIFSCSLVAYAFARLEWPGRDFCFVLLLATLMVPPQVTMIPAFMIIKYLGWYNTLKPLWVPAFLGNAFFVFLLRQFMKGIPRDLEDAAKIDGCGFLRVYWYVMLPLVKPTLAAVAIFTFMGTWNEFMGPLIYVADQRLYPLALGLFSFQLMAGSSYGMLMSGSIIMTLPVVAVFFFAQRYFIQGVTLTGMKG